MENIFFSIILKKKKKLIALQFKERFCLSKLVEKKCFFRAFTGNCAGVITVPHCSKSVTVDVQLSLVSAVPWNVIYAESQLLFNNGKVNSEGCLFLICNLTTSPPNVPLKKW